jgi:undecaprenyl-diphosphatase
MGLAVVALASVSLGKLVEDVTHGDGLALVDHPVARFVTAHRTPALTAAMGAVSTVGGPAAMAGIAAAAGVLIAAAWRSWVPVVELGVTVAGIIGLTMMFKAVLGLSRPPLAQAVAAADGYGFPSGHAATAAAVCGVAACLATMRIHSGLAQVGIWALAAMLAAAVGISRVYLGVHWATDVIGGWVFGILWMAMVVSGWAFFGRVRRLR